MENIFIITNCYFSNRALKDKSKPWTVESFEFAIENIKKGAKGYFLQGNVNSRLKRTSDIINVFKDEDGYIFKTKNSYYFSDKIENLIE